MSAPPERRPVFGTAGHVDHGKTALVRALTGVETDRLPAEKERGISIELGFAGWGTPSGRSVSFIDVPGHERFVRHMIAGATGIDGYVLCVAADEGVKPQTVEHVQILTMLGVRDGVIAVTRSDLADPHHAAEQARSLVPAPLEIVCVSAMTGSGMTELAAAIDRLVDRLADTPEAARRSRLFVDRRFSRPGSGTVVTGTLWGRGFAVADHVHVHPSGATGRIRRLEVHGLSCPSVGAGRVAVALAGVPRAGAGRGSCVVLEADGWRPTTQAVVEAAVPEGGALALRSGARVQMTVGTAEIRARVRLLERQRLEAGDSGLAVLRLEEPLLIEPGDIGVLRLPGHGTVGRARILDLDVPRRLRGPDVERLRALRDGSEDARILARLLAAGFSGMPSGEVPSHLDAVRLGAMAFSGPVVDDARRRLLDGLRERATPLATARAMTGLPPAAATDLVESVLTAGDAHLREGWLSSSEPSALSRQQERIMAELRRAGARGVRHSVLVERLGVHPSELRHGLRELAVAGMAERLGDYWFDHATVREAICVAAHALAEGTKSLSQLRDLWGTSRRPALALATHMDKLGLSAREGEVRRAGRPAFGEPASRAVRRRGNLI